MPPIALPLAAGELPYLKEITLLVLAAAVIGYVCQRIKIVPIVGFLLAGVVIGPGGFGLVESDQVVATVADYGVILLLFTIGLEFSLEQLARIKSLIFGAGTFQVVGTIALVAGGLMLFGVSWQAAIFTGCLVSLSSTAIVLKVLSDGGNTDTAAGRTSLGILIFQDLAVVAMVMLVPMLAPAGEGDDGGGVLGILKALGIGGAIIAVVLVLARKVVPIILEFVARTCRGEIFLLSVIAICVATAYVTSIAGVSAALGAFLGGLVVSESKFRHHAFGEIMPLQILFSATFFVSVGMLLDVGFVLENILLVLAVVGVVAMLKLAVTTLAVKLLRRSWPVALGSGLILLQVGEFAFVLGRLGMDNGLSPMGRNEDGFALFIASAVLLMMLTPVLTGLGLKLAQRTTSSAPAEADSSGEAMSNHVVVAGWGEGGKMIATSLQDAGVPLVVVTLSPPGIEEAKSAGHRVIFGATSRSASLEEAGAERASAVVIADDDAETTERGVAVARYWVDRGGQAGRIVARVMEPGEVDKVKEAGADIVIENQRAGASCVLGEVLASVGFSAEDAEKHVETLLRREV